MTAVALAVLAAITTFAPAPAVLAAEGDEGTIAQPPPSFENPRKLVIQMNSPDEKHQQTVLNNIRNLLKFYENNVRIAVVVYGPAIGMVMKGSPFADRIQSLTIYGVEFVACGNTLSATGRPRENLLPDVTYATAGLAEIAERQMEGWIYLKP